MMHVQLIHSVYFPFLLLCFMNSVYIMIAQCLHGMERRNLYKMIKKVHLDINRLI